MGKIIYLLLINMADALKQGKSLSNPETWNNVVLAKNSLGFKHSVESKAKISEAFKGKKLELVTCPHCTKTGGKPVMNRWHFNNCKQKEKNNG